MSEVPLRRCTSYRGTSLIRNSKEVHLEGMGFDGRGRSSSRGGRGRVEEVSLSLTLSLSHTITHTNTHTLSHTHTHSHTHTLSLSLTWRAWVSTAGDEALREEVEEEWRRSSAPSSSTAHRRGSPCSKIRHRLKIMKVTTQILYNESYYTNQ